MNDENQEAFDIEAAADHQYRATLDVVRALYGELLSASSRADRDKLLLYSSVGLIVGTTGSLPSSILPIQLPLWALGVGISVVIAFFDLSYFIGLQADVRKFDADREHKQSLQALRVREDWDKAAAGIEGYKLKAGWLEHQNDLDAKMRQRSHSIEDDLSLTGEQQRWAYDRLQRDFLSLGFLDIGYTPSVEIMAARERLSFLMMAQEYNDSLILPATRHLRLLQAVTYTPIALGLGAIIFVLASLLLRLTTD